MITRKTIWQNQTGLLFSWGKFRGVLSSGVYFILWGTGSRILAFDLRPKALVIPGQEMLTKGGIPIKVTTSIRFRITKPYDYYQLSENQEEYIYQLVQQATREVVNKVEFEEVISDKEEVNSQLRQRFVEIAEETGIELLAIYIKDVILTPALKEACSRVIETKKNAEASLISTREQIANARALKNLAQMYEENPVLLKLLELQTAKEVGSKSGTVVFSGASNTSFIPVDKNPKD